MHTPTPWKVDKNWMGPESYGDGDGIPIFPTSGGVAICDIVARNAHGLSRPDIQQQAEANAALIVKAVNSYEAMLEALKGAQNDINFHGGKLSGGTIDAIKKAFTLAEGK